ncbi:MAG TPA: hypothetical protein VN436_17880 [Holophaga sp.]|nr:hypothetical protein [Holophaga sp.]
MPKTIPPSRRNAEPTEELRGKVPISTVSRLQQLMEAQGTKHVGSILHAALDPYLKAQGF